jgi:hypothetical protein
VSGGLPQFRDQPGAERRVVLVERGQGCERLDDDDPALVLDASTQQDDRIWALARGEREARDHLRDVPAHLLLDDGADLRDQRFGMGCDQIRALPGGFVQCVRRAS